MKKVFLFLFVSLTLNSTILSQDKPVKWFYLPQNNQNFTTLFQANEIESISNAEPRMENNSIIYPNFRPFPNAKITQSGLSIDVHPSDINKMLLSANMSDWPVTTFFGSNPLVTIDGGKTWTSFTKPPFGINNGNTVSLIGSNGNFYEGFININNGQSLASSTNNGITWISNLIASVNGTGSILDKNHLNIDKIKGSLFENRLYAAWTRFQEGHPNNNRIELTFSNDFGKSWSALVDISKGVEAGSHDQGVNIQIGKNGEVFCTWVVYDEWSQGSYEEDAIGFNKSTDGGKTWGDAVRIYSSRNFGIRGYIKQSGIRVASFPSMSINQNTGEIFISWAQRGTEPAGNDPDIVFIRSTDEGRTWTPPVRVNDDPINNGKDQYYNWSTIDQTTGDLYMVFYDSRNVTNDSAEVYMARSTNSSGNFKNIKISDDTFLPKPITGFYDGYQGDYIGIAALDNWVFPCWADDRTGNYQGWMTKIRYLPEIIHKPLPNTEDIEGPYLLSIKIESGLPVKNEKCQLHYWRSGYSVDSLPLFHIAGTNFMQYIPGINSAATYNYFISVEDSLGGVNRLPEHPDQYFSFKAMLDTEGPIIKHTPISEQPANMVLPEIKVNAEDQFGVGIVTVEYNINNNNDLLVADLNYYEGDIWRGSFEIDSSQLTPGVVISYRIRSIDVSGNKNISYLPVEGMFKINIVSPKGVILVVDDELSTAKLTSADLISGTLKEAGFIVEQVKFSSLETGLLERYDVVALCAGTKTSGIFDDEMKRKAIIDFNLRGGKVFVEGGEVGWVYRFSYLYPEKDIQFRRTILRDSSWIEDYKSGLIHKRIPAMTVFNYPNYIPDSITLIGNNPGEVDVMHTMPNTPGIFKLTGWISKYPDSVGIIAYSPTADTNSITNIFCTFSLGAIIDSGISKKLIENLFSYLKFGYLVTPVNIVSLSATSKNNDVTILWETGNEINNIGFAIERKSESNFHRIGFAQGGGTTSENKLYSFLDRGLDPGMYTYRLKQIDQNGTYEYSHEVIAEVSKQINFHLDQNFPNPFNSMTSINFSIPKEDFVSLSVYNILGEKVQTLLNKKLQAGEHKCMFNASGLPSGIFFYTIKSGDYTVTKKMILLK